MPCPKCGADWQEVGPEGGTCARHGYIRRKTEIIRALERTPKVFPLSELTARTFASGLETGSAGPSSRSWDYE